MDVDAPRLTTDLLLTSAIDCVIDELERTGIARGEAGAAVDIRRFAVKPPAGQLLEQAARLAEPGGTIEIGCASALSTLYICRGRSRRGAKSAAGDIHVIDPKQRSHWKNIGRRALERAGLAEVVSFHELPAHVALPVLVEQRVRITFAFIDGWHMLDHVMLEAFYCDLMLKEDGIIAVHDLWMPSLQHFACFWCANRAYEPVTVCNGVLCADPWPVNQPPDPLPDACASAHFRRRIAPFVRESVLLLRKRGSDTRRWDEFHDFAG